MEIKKITRFVIKDKIPLNSNVFYYLSLMIVAMITVYPWFYAGLACGDDMASVLITRFGKVFSNARFIAELQGRFQFLVALPVQNLAFAWDNMFIVKLFQVIPILFCLFLFYRIVLIITKSRDLSALYVLLFFITAQVSGHTSLFVNYPLYFTFPFSLLLLAYLLIDRFQKKNNYWTLIGSALLFATGLMFYEMFILFIWFAALAIIYHNFAKGDRGVKLLKTVAFQLLPFILVVVFFLAAYVLYGHYHPSQYDGTKMASNTNILGSFFAVLWGLTYTALPLTVYDASRAFFANQSDFIDGYHNIVPYLFAHARIEWLVKAVLVFGMSYFLLVRTPKIPYRTLLIGFLLSVMFTFFPHIPLALTGKYIYYVTTQGMLGYVTTFFSLFGVLLFLSVSTAFVLNFTRNFTLLRHVTALVVAVGFVFCGFLTDFSNFYVCQDIHQANIRLYTVDEMLKSEKFKAIPPNSNMYACDLWNNPSAMAGGLTVQNFEWSYYFFAKAGLSQVVFHNDSSFLSEVKKAQKPGYRILYKQAFKSDDALLALARLKQPGENDARIDSVSDRILIVYYSKYKQFTVSFKKQASAVNEKTKIKINHINDEIDPGEYVEFIVYNTKLNDPATIFTIECPSILIKSIHISNQINRDWKEYYL
jgi:hypothetical protein